MFLKNSSSIFSTEVKPSSTPMEVTVLSCIEGYAAILDKPAGITTEELLRQFEPIGQIWFIVCFVFVFLFWEGCVGHV